MQTGFLSEARRAGSEPTGMRSVSLASRHYREEMPQAGHLDLADLHSLAQPGVRGSLPGYGGHSRADRGLDTMQQGLASIVPQTGAMRLGFGTPSHFLGSAAGSLDEYSAQNPNPHHAAYYMMRGKASHNPYYRGSLSNGHGSPTSGDGSPGLTQQHIVSNCKRKWLSPPGAHQDALTELARENLLLKHQLNLASQEVDRLKHVLEAYDLNQEEGRSSTSKGQSRYWTEEEHQRFLDAIQNYGHKDVKAIASVVGTRNATQVRTHAQKYFIKLARSRKQSQSSGLPISSDAMSNPDREDMEDGEGMDGTGREEITDKSLEAAVAAAGQAGTSAAAAAAFVAATQSKPSSQHGKVCSRHELRMDNNSSSSKAKREREPLVSSNLELVSSANKGVSAMERKSANSASRHRKRSGSKGGNGNNPGSPGSMGSSGSVGSSDATSNGNGSNGSNDVRSSDTTNGNGSSNGSNSNGHCNEHGSSGDSGGGVDSNNGVSSNEGSDHGFFDTAGEDGGNFSDELDGAGGGSDEGYLDHPSQSQHSQMCLPNEPE